MLFNHGAPAQFLLLCCELTFILLQSFRVSIVNFESFFCLSIPIKRLRYKQNTAKIEVSPESLGAVLQHWYIERGLLAIVQL